MGSYPFLFEYWPAGRSNKECPSPPNLTFQFLGIIYRG